MLPTAGFSGLQNHLECQWCWRGKTSLWCRAEQSSLGCSWSPPPSETQENKITGKEKHTEGAPHTDAENQGKIRKMEINKHSSWKRVSNLRSPKYPAQLSHLYWSDWWATTPSSPSLLIRLVNHHCTLHTWFQLRTYYRQYLSQNVGVCLCFLCCHQVTPQSTRFDHTEYKAEHWEENTKML